MKDLIYENLIRNFIIDFQDIISEYPNKLTEIKQEILPSYEYNVYEGIIKSCFVNLVKKYINTKDEEAMEELQNYIYFFEKILINGAERDKQNLIGGVFDFISCEKEVIDFVIHILKPYSKKTFLKSLNTFF